MREERPAVTSCCGPRLPGPPKLWPLLCRGAAGRGLSASPGSEEPVASTTLLGSQLAPGGTGVRHNKPIDWGHPGTVPSAPTSATRQLPPPWPRGHRGCGGFPALTRCITLISRYRPPLGLAHPRAGALPPAPQPTSYTPKHCVRLPSSAPTLGVLVSKREWGDPASPAMPG